MKKPSRIVAIGGSARAIKAMREIFDSIPENTDAAILIVVHVAFDSPSFLDSVVDKVTGLKVVKAENKMPIQAGMIYVASPNKHLFARDGHVYLTNGPRENLFRPSIDVLFRSVGVAYGNRAIGVLLSGLLNGGATGLEAIQKCGGITMVQNPETAMYGDMPSFAQQTLDIDHVLELEDISAKLQNLINSPSPELVEAPQHLVRENEIVNTIGSSIPLENDLGHQVPISCPSCSGPLWEMEHSGVKRYRCHVGHSFTESALLEGQNEALEETLWVSLRTFEEKKMLLQRLVDRFTEKDKKTMVRSYKNKISEVSKHIKQLRTILQISEQ